jgi:hypothetical protein
MLAKILSAALVGLDAYLIDVEVDIAGGLFSSKKNHGKSRPGRN